MPTDELLRMAGVQEAYAGAIKSLQDTLDDVGEKAKHAFTRQSVVRRIYFTLGVTSAVMAAVAGFANLASLLSTTVAGLIGLTAAALAAADKVVAASKTAESRDREAQAWDRLLFRVECTRRDIDAHIDEIVAATTLPEQHARREFFEAWLAIKKEYYRRTYEALKNHELDAVLDPTKTPPEPPTPRPR